MKFFVVVNKRIERYDGEESEGCRWNVERGFRIILM